MSRKLKLSRIGNNKVLALHDAETGEILSQQIDVTIINELGLPLRVNVTFLVDGEHVSIVGDKN